MKSRLRIHVSILAVVAIFSWAWLVTVVLPKATQLVRGRGEDLPLPTQTLITVSDLLANHWPLMLVSTLSVILLLRLSANSEPGRYVWARFKLAICTRRKVV